MLIALSASNRHVSQVIRKTLVAAVAFFIVLSLGSDPVWSGKKEDEKNGKGNSGFIGKILSKPSFMRRRSGDRPQQSNNNSTSSSSSSSRPALRRTGKSASVAKFVRKTEQRKLALNTQRGNNHLVRGFYLLDYGVMAQFVSVLGLETGMLHALTTRTVGEPPTDAAALDAIWTSEIRNLLADAKIESLAATTGDTELADLNDNNTTLLNAGIVSFPTPAELAALDAMASKDAGITARFDQLNPANAKLVLAYLTRNANLAREAIRQEEISKATARWELIEIEKNRRLEFGAADKNIKAAKNEDSARDRKHDDDDDDVDDKATNSGKEKAKNRN